jgi:hypothetical protein
VRGGPRRTKEKKRKALKMAIQKEDHARRKRETQEAHKRKIV